ncbi:MAG: glutamine-hydrolyzing carbamoyl-phosphate synthase small subunit, partial [Actinomycetota bacterium]|nr:glutamine-hydrolyzing carbamoyl-phosphate synthase small subunit [Actinomycetota bacterium]
MTEHLQPALLCTADGEVFRGLSVGATGVATGEAVFNTSMTGYQEILTDPSYAGQVVVMTASHIGNYGLTKLDEQSSRPAVSGFVMRAMSRRDSNWRSEGAIAEYLHRHGVVAITDVDTRRLTRYLRDRGAMPVAIGAEVDEAELRSIAAAAPSMEGQNLVSQVTTPTPYHLQPSATPRGRIVAIDLGIKRDMLDHLTSRGFAVEVVPAETDSGAILALDPDGVFLSNGPGDPEPLTSTTETLRSLLGKVPLFGVCLGHQVLGLAIGARTFK